MAVHAHEREYLLRGTLSDVLKRLPAGMFVRVHGSYGVNIDRISELRSTGGGPRILLEGGQELPLAKARRQAVLEVLMHCNPDTVPKRL